MWYESDREADEQDYGTLTSRLSNFAALILILLFLSGPLWMLPLPESLEGGWLGTFKYGMQVLQCHFGLMLLPCAYLLLRVLLNQSRWIERVKLIVLIALCLWISLTSLREVYWIWRGYSLWIVEYFSR